MVKLKPIDGGKAKESSRDQVKAISRYVTIDDLASFEANPGEGLRTENYLGAQKAWQGLNNFESLDGSFGAGHEILGILKPAERIALYIGIAQVKIDENMARTEPNQRYKAMLEIPNSGFGYLMSWLISIGYKYNAVRVMGNKEENVEFIKERMDRISDIQKNVFVDSLRIAWRNPSPVTESYPYKYPFEDLGIERETATTQNLRWYLKKIVAFMGQVYTANTGPGIKGSVGA